MANKVKQFRLNNLTGGMNSQGEANTLASFDYKGTGVQAEAEDIENFVPLNRGGQSKTTGFSLFKDTSSANKITGLYRFIKSDGTSLFLFSQTTKVYKLVSGTITDLGATISSGAYTHFETALDKCIICDGVSAPATFDGTTIGSLTNAPSVLRATLFYANRLFGFGNTGANSSYVYYSDAGTLNNMANNFISCDVNDGQKIVSISKYFIPGSLEPIIFVQKERSSGIIFGDGTAANPYTFVKSNQDIGGVGFRASVQFGQDIAYLTPRGVTSYKVDNSILNLTYFYLSEKVRNKFQALNASALLNSIAFYDWKRTRISFAVPEDSNTTPNVIWHYDTRLSCWYKERWNPGQDCTAAMVDTDGTWYHGDTNGKIYSHGASDYSFDNQAINAFYTTGYMDFGDPTLYKRLQQSRIMARAQGAYNLGISAKLNYGLSNGRSHTIQLNGSAALWGTGLWGSGFGSSSNQPWGSAPIQFPKFFPGGVFQNIQFTFSQPGANQPIDIFELEFLTEFTGLI